MQCTCTGVLARVQMHDVSESIALSECLTCKSGTCTCRDTFMSLHHGESPKSKRRRLDRERQRRRRASESELERSNRLDCNAENRRRRRSRESGMQSHTTKARKVETVDDRQHCMSPIAGLVRVRRSAPLGLKRLLDRSLEDELVKLTRSALSGFKRCLRVVPLSELVKLTTSV